MLWDLLDTIRPYLPYIIVPLCLNGLYHIVSRLIPGPHRKGELNLRDRTVLITGASGGLGRALAFEFFSRGAKVILTARGVAKLEKLCAELHKANQRFGWNNPHRAEFRYLDLSELANRTNAADDDDDNDNNGGGGLNELRALAIDGRTIDVLVNNAGVSNRGSCAATTLDIQRRVMEVNFFGAVSVTRALLNALPDDGAIVSIGSLQSRVALPYRSAYSASKHAIQAFFDSLRGEKRELHVLVVNAGYINTNFGASALNADGEAVGGEDENQRGGMAPETAARRVVDALVARDTELVLAHATHRMIIWLRVLAPNLLWWVLRRRAQKERGKAMGN